VNRAIALVLVALLSAATGVVAGFWAAERGVLQGWSGLGEPRSDQAAPVRQRAVLYYRDPTGKPDYSAGPKKDDLGRDYIPVYEDEEPALDHPQPAGPSTTQTQSQPPTEKTGRRILYYRNPMGLPDTSPTPKKDPMGMDYIPVYEGEAANDPAIVQVSPQRVQMLGVRTEGVKRRDLVRPISAVGTVQFDERRTFIVSTKFEGWIERLLVNATGETVRRGQPLMQVYSPDLLLAQQEYATLRASLAQPEGEAASEDASRRLLDGALQRLRYLDFPEEELAGLRQGAAPRRTLTLRSPYAGTVVEKKAVEGMRFMPGEPLYTIVDMSAVWLIADVFEQDLGDVRIGQEATITLKAYPARAFKGRVAFIYPTVGEQTRTARVRIEIANSDGLLKADMYANVEITSSIGRRDVLAVPDSAVIDNGIRQVVLIDRGEGRFQPRPVRLGTRAGGFVEVLDGVREGERVVTSANFLIDAESNLRAALQAFTAGEHQH
jgi:membrane fusion protein, copper/silver efflux system